MSRIHRVIYGGGVFTLRNKYKCSGKIVLLGVAFDWGYRKGLDIIIDLSKILDDRFVVVLVGINKEVERTLPPNIIAIGKTNSIVELSKIYSMADIFINPTREEVFGMVNIEALACGIPIIVSRTGGCPEIVTSSCGIVVDRNDAISFKKAIEKLLSDKRYTAKECLRRSEQYEKNKKIDEYIRLYEASN